MSKSDEDRVSEESEETFVVRKLASGEVEYVYLNGAVVRPGLPMADAVRRAVDHAEILREHGHRVRVLIEEDGITRDLHAAEAVDTERR